MSQENKPTSLVPLPEEQNNFDITAPLTRDTLGQFMEHMQVRKAKRIVPRIYKCMEKGLDEGNTKTLELAMETFGLRAKGAGVTVVTNLFNNTQVSNGSEGKSAAYFEGILRRLEEKEKTSKIIDIG